MVFARAEFERLANIFDNAGQVFLAGFVIAPFFSGIDKTTLFMIVLMGFVFTGVCWFFSLQLTKLASKL